MKKWLAAKRVAPALTAALLVWVWRGAVLPSDTSRSSRSEEAPKVEVEGRWWQRSPLWVEDRKPHVVNAHGFSYLANNPDACGSPTAPRAAAVDLLIAVCSATAHRDRRDAIRRTWGSPENLARFDARLVFLLGQGPDSQSSVALESSQFGDIVQEDFQVSPSAVSKYLLRHVRFRG